VIISCYGFFTTFQELLFGVPASPQPPPKEGEKYKGKNLVLWHTERNYRVINSFVFLKICEEPCSAFKWIDSSP
jgi:hypothetical protein